MRRYLALATLLLLSSAKLAFAQTGLTISPPTLDLIIKPNTRLIQNIELKNLGNDTNYEITLQKLLPQGLDGGNTIDLTPLDPSTLPAVFKINNTPLAPSTTIDLSAKEAKTLTLTIETKNQTTPLDAYLALVFRPNNAHSPLSSTAIIGLPILLTITSDESLPLNLSLENFDLPKIADSFFPLTLEPTLKNQGPHMLRPSGTLTIKNPRGQATTYNLANNLILSETARNLSFIEAKPLVLRPNLFRLGPHTFTLTITTQSGKTILENSQIVWFLPIRLILIIFVLTTFSLAIYLRLQKPKNTC